MVAGVYLPPQYLALCYLLCARFAKIRLLLIFSSNRMNSCILMAVIIQEPQLRYTQDETAMAEMLVEFAATRAEDPPATLKVVGWGNLATEMAQGYHPGDRVILQGSLRMNTIDRPEGFKEKLAELVVSKIYSWQGEPVATQPWVGATPAISYNGNPIPSHPTPSYPTVSEPVSGAAPLTMGAKPVVEPVEEDEIPF